MRSISKTKQIKCSIPLPFLPIYTHSLHLHTSNFVQANTKQTTSILELNLMETNKPLSSITVIKKTHKKHLQYFFCHQALMFIIVCSLVIRIFSLIFFVVILLIHIDLVNFKIKQKLRNLLDKKNNKIYPSEWKIHPLYLFIIFLFV